MKRKIIVLTVSMLFLCLALTTNVSANSPPETPDISGPPSGAAGSTYTVEVCSSDPDGDNIYFCIDWGDGSGEQCLGPYASDSCINLDHVYSGDGSYTIKVKAQDDSQAESDYATLTVSMPKTKTSFIIKFFQQILERFPIIAYFLKL